MCIQCSKTKGIASTGDHEQVSAPQRLLDQPVGALFWQNCEMKDAFSSPSVWMH